MTKKTSTISINPRLTRFTYHLPPSRYWPMKGIFQNENHSPDIFTELCFSVRDTIEILSAWDQGYDIRGSGQKVIIDCNDTILCHHYLPFLTQSRPDQIDARNIVFYMLFAQERAYQSFIFLPPTLLRPFLTPSGLWSLEEERYLSTSVNFSWLHITIDLYQINCIRIHLFPFHISLPNLQERHTN